jgi:hypothetical protein
LAVFCALHAKAVRTLRTHRSLGSPNLTIIRASACRAEATDAVWPRRLFAVRRRGASWDAGAGETCRTATAIRVRTARYAEVVIGDRRVAMLADAFRRAIRIGVACRARAVAAVSGAARRIVETLHARACRTAIQIWAAVGVVETADAMVRLRAEGLSCRTIGRPCCELVAALALLSACID